MPTKPQYDAVFSRLRAITELIEQEARESEGFFEGLQKILMTPEAMVALDKPQIRSKAPILPVLAILHEQGETTLREQLERLTNDKLARLAADEGIKRLKDAKNTERNDLVAAILETARNRLKQGEAFTR
jgi:hypothetical protein